MSEKDMNNDEIYMVQMDAWLKEQEVLRKQILMTIETSSEIVKLNKIQLEYQEKKINNARKEYAEWKVENNHE